MLENKGQAKQGEQVREETKVEQPKRSMKIKTSVKAGPNTVCD